ncbi:hypothetical protein [Shewanella spartinae]|uniref:hypothetical protein n=1 Tax=Shewanella spartinae TaxID=2864205 RepID=UPI001C65BE5F|nr:hypothetical protein [Shewanella spartinae]QYJ95431.1 hypothetical protein K0I31_08760 [Shewanella spartinae]
MKVWRLNIKTAAKTGVNPRKFCLDNNILGAGWSISLTGEVDWENYIREAKVKFKGRGRSFSAAINAIKNRMKVGDLCWTRDHDGNYYLGVVLGEWEYKSDSEYQAANVVNIRSCKWFKVGAVDVVPGKVVNSYISGSTIQQVKGHEILTYCQYLANSLLKEERYKISKSSEDILTLLSSDDCEDLVALYMQQKHGFMVIPSSCKSDTAVYEYVMKHSKTGRKAVAQVKHGNVNLNIDDYRDIEAEVYLLTTRGHYLGEPMAHIHCLKPDMVLEFAKSNYHLMPDRIQNWIDFGEKMHT